MLHFLWQVKFGEKIAVIEPLVYAGIFAALMAVRVPGWIRQARLRSKAKMSAKDAKEQRRKA